MNNKPFAILILLLVMNLISCHSEKTTEKTPLFTIVVVKPTTVPTQLYYSGIVAPINFYNIVSPTDAVITSLNFKYGQFVQQGNTLLTMNSTKLKSDYRTALSDYLKATEDYNNAKVNFQGTQALQQAKIISQQEYLSDKAQYDATVLAYLNARHTLSQLIKKIPGAKNTQLEEIESKDLASFAKVSLGNVTMLNKILKIHTNDLPIIADREGVVLSPPKESAEGSSDDSSKPLQVGSQVKEGQALVTIGDLSGIATTVSVSEMVINQIKVGQDVLVNITALPNLNLQGKVKAVGAQAQSTDQGQSGVATFPVTVEVAKITPAQMQLIRVGMTTKIQIMMQNPPQIMVPINAVMHGNNGYVVTILNAQGKKQNVPVTTGQTTADSVAILQGLHAGDRVVVPTAAPLSTTSQ